MEDKSYPNFVQGLVLTICLVLFLVTSYALESIPIRLNISVPDFYVPLASAFSSFLFIPIIFYALKKSKINILENIHFPNLIVCGMLVLLAISFAVLTLPLVSPIIYSHLILTGQLGFFNFKFLVFDATFIIVFSHRVVLAPAFEEIFFRGILLQQFLKRYSSQKAILLSGLLFAFVHLKLLGSVELFVYGIMLGYVFYKTNSIVASFIVHSVGNLMLELTKHYTIQMDDSSLTKAFFILSASILVVYFFVKYIDHFQDKHADDIIIIDK
jgi:membrane protease YdiL (CAAX protease family)